MASGGGLAGEIFVLPADRDGGGIGRRVSAAKLLAALCCPPVVVGAAAQPGRLRGRRAERRHRWARRPGRAGREGGGAVRKTQISGRAAVARAAGGGAVAAQFCLYMPMGGCRWACCFLNSALVITDDLPEKKPRAAPSGELAGAGLGGSWLLYTGSCSDMCAAGYASVPPTGATSRPCWALNWLGGGYRWAWCSMCLARSVPEPMGGWRGGLTGWRGW